MALERAQLAIKNSNGRNGKVDAAVDPPLWARMRTRPMQFVLDATWLGVAFCIAYLLRFDFDLPSGQGNNALIQLPAVVLVQMAFLVTFGVYAFIWRYVGLAEVPSFAKAALFSAAVLVCGRLAFPQTLQAWRIPLGVTVFDAVLGFGGVVALRVVRRIFYERYEKNRLGVADKAKKKSVLFVGAGRAGVMAAKEVLARSDMDITVKGFVDDDVMKHGSVIHGVKVLGPTSLLPALVDEMGIDHVVLTIARATRGSMRRILEICEEIPVRVRVIPGLFEILDGRVEVTRIRDVQIEDLLGRDPVNLDETEVSRAIKDAVVVVTGAGGSIGSELCRQVARYAPKKLVLIEQAENALFLIDKELRETFPTVDVEPCVCDILDEDRVRRILTRERPHMVFHAAAHKHVPMMEKNPGEAVKNNVLGTRILADVSAAVGVERFVMISTDKAVNPTSVMGTSKRIAELYVQALSQKSKTRFLAVRFGNVLGSNGSVVPIFKAQIERGGPVTVTHPEMRRYFMTIPEAAQLVVQAGVMGQGGEIFILDMGEPVKIVDLARDLITLSGFRPGVDIHIEFTGLRPGEKLFEELAVGDENASKTHHPKIFVGQLRPVDLDVVRTALTSLAAAAHGDDTALLLAQMRALVPEFASPAPTEVPAPHDVPLSVVRTVSPA